MEHLFSYGTLQQAEVQLKLFGRKLKGSPDALKGYRAVKIRLEEKYRSDSGEDYNLIAVGGHSQGDIIHGLTLELTEEELLFSDKYEPPEYIRISVQLESGLNGWVYAAKEPSDIT